MSEIYSGTTVKINKENAENYKAEISEIIGRIEQEKIDGVEGKTLSGEYISANDIENEKGIIIPSGNDYQKTSEASLNILDLEKLEVYQTSSGATYDISNSNSIKVTATADNSYQNVAFKLDLEDGDYVGYLGSAKVSNTEMTTKRMTISEYVDGVRTALKHIDVENNNTFTIANAENKVYVLEFWGNYSTKIENTTTYTQCYIAKGTSFSAYEDFTPNMPSIYYPSPVRACGDNINLFDKAKYIYVSGYFDDNGNVVNSSLTGRTTMQIAVESNTTYIIDGFSILGNVVQGNVARVYYFDSEHNFISRSDLIKTTEFVFTTPSNCNYIDFSISIGTSPVFETNLNTFKLSKGTSTGGYSEYGQGNITVVKSNKNIFDVEKFKNMFTTSSFEIYNGVECFKIPGGSKLYPFAGKKNTQYTFQFNLVGYTYENIGGFQFLYDDGTYNPGIYPGSKLGKFSMTSEVNKTVAGVRWGAWSAGHFFYIEKNTMQLEEASSATEAIPHQGKTYIVPTQQPMLEGDTFVKQSGKWYEKHNWKELVLNGSEAWSIANGVFFISSIKDYATSDNIPLSKYFKGVTNVSGVVDMSNQENNTIGFINNTTNYRFYIKCNDFNTTEELKTWLSENNVPLSYKIAEPILIPCTEDQNAILEELYNTEIYLPTTNIYSTDEIQPINTLRYNYVIASPSIEIPSPVRACGDNVNILITENSSNYTINPDGTYNKEINRLCSDFIKVNSNKQDYILSANQSLGFVGIAFYDKDKNYVGREYKNGVKTLAITKPSNVIYLRVFFQGNLLSSQSWLLSSQSWFDYGIKLEKGSTATTYSKPSQGSMTIVKSNKNLADLTKKSTGISACKIQNKNTNSIELISTNTWSNCWFCFEELKDNSDYVISANFLETVAESARVGISVYGNNVPHISGATNIGKYDIKSINKNVKEIRSVSFNTLNYKYVYIRFWNNYSETSVTEGNSLVKVIDIQLEESPIKTDYVEHQSEEYVIPTQQPFYKGDTFVKIGDEWYEKHNFKRHILNGTENIILSGSVNGIYQFNITIDDLKIASEINYKNDVLSNGFGSINYWTNSWLVDNVVLPIVKEKKIRFQTSKYIATEEFKTELAEQHSNGTPIYIVYPLAEPTLIRCIPAQENILELLQNILLYNGITYLSTESSVNPELIVLVKKMIEDYNFYISSDGYLVINDLNIKYLVDLTESNLPTMPEAVESSVRAAGRDGDIVLNTTYEPIPFNIVCYTDDNLSLQEKVNEEKKINRFLNAMKNNFKILAMEKDNKFYNVKYNGALTTINFPKHLKFSIPLKSSQSYAKDFAKKTIIGNNSEESNTIENVGAVFTIKGPAQNPIISFNDYSMEYNMSILEGARIEIDTNKSTITHFNSDGVKTNVMKHYNHQFPKIENGINELKVLSGLDDEENVTVIWNDLKL